MKNKYFEFFYPTINDKQSAIKAVTYGYVAAAFTSFLTLFHITIKYLNAETVDYILLISSLVGNVLPIAVLGFFIFKNSRIASILAFILCLIEIFYKFSETGSTGIFPIFLVFYLNSVRGTFALKKLENDDVN
jgi:hypothetical protein